MATNVRGVWGYRWWIAAVTIVATLAAYVGASRLSASYSATSLAQVISGPEQAGTYVDQNSLLQLTNYYLAQAQTTPVAAQTAKDLGGKVTSAEIRKRISVSSTPDSQELKFSATSSDPRQAARYANAYAQAFASRVTDQQRAASKTTLGGYQDQISAIEKQIADPNTPSTVASALTTELSALQTQAATAAARPSDAINLIQRATPPTSPSSPKPKQDAALVLILVLLLCCAGAYARAEFSDRYRSADEVAEDTGMALLGEVPLLAVSDPAAVEAFQSLRTVIEFVAHDLIRPSFVVTSARTGAGKTHVVLNLAGALAAGERHVVLVDGDLRRPAVHERLGLSREPGFSDALMDESKRARAGGSRGSVPRRGHATNGVTHQPTTSRAATNGGNGSSGHNGSDSHEESDRFNGWSAGEQPRRDAGSLEVVTAGTAIADPVSVLNSTATQRMMAGFRRSYELTLFDSPPMTIADATVLARGASGVIVVIDARRDRRAWVRQLVERLRSLDLPISGFVFNRSSSSALVDGYYQRPAVSSDVATDDGPAVSRATKPVTSTPQSAATTEST